MSVDRASLPLTGGEPGAEVVVHPLLCGDMSMPEGWVHYEPGVGGALRAFATTVRGRLRAPVVAYLLEHPSAGPVVVDTGFHPDVLTDKRSALGVVNSLVFSGIRMRPEDTVAAQLSARGLAPGDVRLIVMTHLHADHASGLASFPKATVVVTETEWEAANAGDAGRNGYHSDHLDPLLDYRFVSFPRPAPAGRPRVEQALDLFGDGSVRLLSTPGHTRGHMSLIVRMHGREALLAGDAIYTLATLHEGKRPFRTVNRREYEESVQTLAAYQNAHPDALVVPGHDMEALKAAMAELGGATRPSAAR